MGKPYSLFALLWALAIFWGASARVEIGGYLLFPQEDKLAHFIEFALLALLIHRAFYHSSRLSLARQAAKWAFIISVCYGGVLEVYQRYLPYRSCDIVDFLADCAGILAALFISPSARSTDA